VTLQRHVLGQEDVGRSAGAQCGEQPVPLPKDPADGIRNQGHRGTPRLPMSATGSVDTSPPGHPSSSPVSKSVSKDAASRTGVPSSSAFLSLLAPGASPTTSAKVFFDTLPGDVPPRATIASSAPSRVYPGTAPVTTTAFPASVWAA